MVKDTDKENKIINKHSPIGLFDSGVGGTSVLKQVMKVLPHEDVIFYGDSGNAPYGEKTAEVIQNLCHNIADFLVAQGCKIIVIACNTATVAALDILRDRIDIPIIGVISPGAKAALAVSQNKKIGVISTAFTAKTRAYPNEIAKLDKEAEVYPEGCSEYVPMIEGGWSATYSDDERMSVIKKHMDNLPRDIDTLVLGCTHFPIAYDEHAKLFHGHIVDPAVETARELAEVLRNTDLLNDSPNLGHTDFYITGDEGKFRTVAESFLGMKIDKIHII